MTNIQLKNWILDQQVQKYVFKEACFFLFFYFLFMCFTYMFINLLAYYLEIQSLIMGK